MPTLDVNGTRLYYEDTGGPGEPIVFSHGLLFSVRMFDAQVAALRGRYRCIAYDHRGQGSSDLPAVESIDMDTLYQDAVTFIERLGVAPCHFVGLSMGGFVGMRIAARRPELLRSLVLLATSGDAEAALTASRYKLLNFIARWIGLRPVASKVMQIMFGRTYLEDPSRASLRNEWRQQLVSNSREIWRAVNGVIHRQGVHEELPRIAAPTLIVVGEEDVATVPAKAERLHAVIRSSRLVRVPRAGHTSTVEEPEQVNAALTAFLDEVAIRSSVS